MSRHPTLVHDTDLCVKCGACVPHCPTYHKIQDENESPRGRLSLIQGWAQGHLEATPDLIRHIDHCLLCRACESVCPARVSYGQIVDTFRQSVREEKAVTVRVQKSDWVREALAGVLSPFIQKIVAGERGITALRRLARVFPSLGWSRLVLGLPSHVSSKQWSEQYSAVNGSTDHPVFLFLGCTASLLDAETISSVIQVMTQLHMTVHIPSNQACCGALHRHSGRAEQARRYWDKNIAAFHINDPHGAKKTRIVSFASGCSAMLSEYSSLSSSKTGASFSERVCDVSQFVSENWLDTCRIKPLPATVALHTPCSLRHVLKAERYPAYVLSQIPELKVVNLPSTHRCCGAAGSYMLEHPKMADSLRDDILDAVVALSPQYLATSNPGCALHLRSGLAQRGRAEIEVLHPVTLLARQWEHDSSTL